MSSALSPCGSRGRVFFDKTLTKYNFGDSHPLHPIRLELTMTLAETFGLVSDLSPYQAPAATLEQLATVHTPGFIESVLQVGKHPERPDLGHGLGTPDNPTFARIDQAAAAVVGATLAACQQVWRGSVTHGVSIAGGLHHAMPNAASGFCVFNDLAVGIQWLLDNGAGRVAYVDLDVHHGDGVEAIFSNDPRVLTISLHESGRTLFPGTGFNTDIGGPDALGSAVNVPLPVGTSDVEWLRAFDAVVPELLRAFQPEVLVSQHGCDSHRSDPLAHLALTVDGQRASYQMVHDLAHELCAGRWVATGGGGYSLVDVVPRAWTHLIALVHGQVLAPETEIPGDWSAYVIARTGVAGPQYMTDGPLDLWMPWSGTFNPESAVDRSIAATRHAVFPHHGLLP
jgi:acetoin utilization protein AcuC